MRTSSVCFEQFLLDNLCFLLQRYFGLGHVVHAVLPGQRDPGELDELAAGPFYFELFDGEFELEASVDCLLVEGCRADQRVRGRRLASSEARDVDDICEEILQPVVFVLSEQLAA